MSRSSPTVQLSWIGGLPAPEARGGPDFRIELGVLDGGDGEAVQPFATLADGARFSRLLLGRLTDGGGETLRLVALKVQRDAYRPLGERARGAVDNREVRAMWRREREALEKLGGGAAARLLAAPQGGLPPTAFDRRTKTFFTVPSPATWGPLAVCEDDELLRDAGLEPWSTTLVRHLHSPGATGDDARTFYAWDSGAGAAAKSGVRMRRRYDLFRDLLARWKTLADGERRELARSRPALAAVLAELDEGELETRIVPLNYAPAQLFVLELEDLHFDEYCDLAAGAPFGRLVDEARRDGVHGRAHALAALEPAFAGEGQWLAAPWLRGDGAAEAAPGEAELARLAVEAAYLKLHAFRQVLHAVRAVHGGLQRPHLGLAPDNVMLRAHGAGHSAAPARWTFTARIADVGASHARELHGLGAAGVPPLFFPAVDAARAYQSPWCDPAAAEREHTLHVTATPAADGLALVARPRRDRIGGIERGDLVRLLPEVALPALGDQPLVGTVRAVSRDHVELHVRLDEKAPRASAPFEFAAAATFHRRLQPPCDLFSLGMLLTRALLGNDEQDAFALREAWDTVLDRLDMSLPGEARRDPARVEGMLRNLLESDAKTFGSRQVLWSRAHRDRASAPVPEAIWRSALFLAARLLTGFPGFSYAAHHGDAAAEPGATLDRVVADVDSLLAALLAASTQAQRRSAEIAAVAGQLYREVAQALVHGGAA